MNSESQDFEQLRQLFAIKRHEVPPPGYFDGFSRDVICRIKAGERGESPAGTWFQRFWNILEAKPIFAGAFGASVCAVLISGILNSEEAAGVPGVAANPVGYQVNPPVIPASIALNGGNAQDSVLSTNPVASLNSLFDFHLTAQPASLTLQTGN